MSPADHVALKGRHPGRRAPFSGLQGALDGRLGLPRAWACWAHTEGATQHWHYRSLGLPGLLVHIRPATSWASLLSAALIWSVVRSWLFTETYIAAPPFLKASRVATAPPGGLRDLEERLLAQAVDRLKAVRRA